MKSQAEEKRGIQHVIDGYPPVEIVGGRMTPEKGVEIRSKKGGPGGIERNDSTQKGVVIHDPRHG